MPPPKRASKPKYSDRDLTLAAVRAFLTSDQIASRYQTLTQYRAAALKVLDRVPAGRDRATVGEEP